MIEALCIQHYNEAARMVNALLLGNVQPENRKFLMEEINDSLNKLDQVIERGKRELDSERLSHWRGRVITARTTLNGIKRSNL